MLPKIPLLNNSTLNSYLFGASYNFNTCIQKEKDASSISKDDSLFDYHGTFIHETTHWIQHHGTSFGSLLSLITYSQHKTAITWLGDLPEEEISELLEQRDNNIPIVKLDLETQKLLAPNNKQSKTNLLRQIWYDHLLVYKTLLQSDSQDNIQWNRGQVIGEVIADAILYGASELGLWQYPNIDIARSYFDFGDDVKFCKFNDTRFTTQNLMETWATSTELSSLYNLKKIINFMTLNDQINNLINNLDTENGQYGLGLKLFLDIYDIYPEDLGSILPTICALCYISLNPPVPPYIMNPHEKLTWDEFYPPIRYIKLIQQVKEIGLLSKFSKHEETTTYCNKIAKLASTPYIGNYEEKVLLKNNHIDFDYYTNQINHSESKLRIYRQGEIDKEGIDYFNYILHIQDNFHFLRKNNINILINIGENSAGDESITLLKLFREEKWFTPLLIWKNNNIHSQSESKIFTGWFMQSIIFHESATDLIAGYGEFDYSMLPKVVLESGIIKENINELWLQILRRKVIK